MVRVVPLQPPPAERRLGSLKGQGIVTADLKKDFAAEIDLMFNGKP